MKGHSRFRVRALRPEGTIEERVLEARDRNEVLERLRDESFVPVAIIAEEDESRGWIGASTDDLASGLRGLATLIQAGFPMARALQALEDLAPAPWLEALPKLRRITEEGGSLADALHASGLPIPPQALGMIEAGELGSGLSAALTRAATLMEGRAEHLASLRDALAYPLILALVGTSSLIVLIGVVLPRFALLITDLGQEVPTPTRILLGLGVFLQTWWWAIVAVPVLVAPAIARWVRSERGRRTWHRWLMELPLVGDVRRSSASGHVCASLAALLESGVPLASALGPAAQATGDMVVIDSIDRVRDRLSLGESIGKALAAEAALTPTAIRLAQLGEQTGQLSTMLEHAGRIEAEASRRRLKAGLRLVEPAMILLFGGVVAFVAAALLQAMYSVRPS